MEIGNFIINDLQYITFFITLFIGTVSSLITAIATTRSAKSSFKKDLVINLQKKRMEIYPSLHVLTDNLGSLIKYNHNIDIATLQKSLDDISKWDANYAVFAGAKVTIYLSDIRQFLSKTIETNSISEEQKKLLFSALVLAEYEMKREMGVFMRNNYTDLNVTYGPRKYRHKVAALNRKEQKAFAQNNNKKTSN